MRFFVYIKPFDDQGVYTEFEDVSRYVTKISSVSQNLDLEDYQIGVFKNSSFNLSLKNETGRFSDVDSSESMFKFLRSGSLVRITYTIGDEQIQAGVMVAGDAIVGEEVEVFKGLLNDEATKQGVKDDVITFTVIGLESLFNQTTVQDVFPTLSVSDLLSVTLFKILDQPRITDLLVVDQANITPTLDQVPDDISFIETMSVKEALDEILFATNSVLYILEDTIYVTPRTETLDLIETWHGPASQTGVENIIDIKEINNGRHRLFNVFRWADTNIARVDSTSKSTYGARIKEITTDFFTNLTKRTNLLDDFLAEFKDPKEEFMLTTPFNYDSLDIKLLDKTNLDYPTVLVAESSGELPICGIAICGQAQLPRGWFGFVRDETFFYKVIQKSHDLNKFVSTFKLRRA